MDININLVRKLVDKQFPDWAHLTIKPVQNGGHDHRTFHLGEEMTIRMPSAKSYEPQIEKEVKWLPKLSQQLTFPITIPLGQGNPTKDYPYTWSVNRWVDGDSVTNHNVDMHLLAEDLAKFLGELQRIDATEGPKAEAHNFYRGGDLAIYHEETMDAFAQLASEIDTEKCRQIWDAALLTKWTKESVWVHGDIAVGNLITKNKRLSGVIDFGCMGTGDPACDLVIAWTFFDESSRRVFINKMRLDQDTWHRAKGWALWKALITYENKASQTVIKALLNED